MSILGGALAGLGAGLVQYARDMREDKKDELEWQRRLYLKTLDSQGKSGRKGRSGKGSDAGTPVGGFQLADDITLDTPGSGLTANPWQGFTRKNSDLNSTERTELREEIERQYPDMDAGAMTTLMSNLEGLTRPGEKKPMNGLQLAALVASNAKDNSGMFEMKDGVLTGKLRFGGPSQKPMTSMNVGGNFNTTPGNTTPHSSTVQQPLPETKDMWARVGGVFDTMIGNMSTTAADAPPSRAAASPKTPPPQGPAAMQKPMRWTPEKGLQQQ